MSGLSGVLVWHGWPLSWELLAEDGVKENGTGAELKGGVGDVERLLSLPVDEKVGDDLVHCVGLGNNGVDQGWCSGLESSVDGTGHGVEDASLEEGQENRGHVCPDVTVNVEFEVVSVDIDNNVDSLYGWHDASIRQGLGCEGNAKSKSDLVKVDLSEPSSNENELLGTEILGDELASNIAAGQNEGVLGGVNGKLHVLGVGVDDEGVLPDVVVLILVEVGQLETVDQGQDLVEVHILCLLQNRDIERA